MNFTENRGMLAVLAAVFLLLAVAIYSYKTTLSQIAEETCSGLEPCSHEKIVWAQDTVIAVLMLAMAAMAAGFFMLTRKKPEAVEFVEKHPQKKIDVSSLEPDEKKVMAILQNGGGSVFQGEIKNKLDYSKVKVSRILDRMEQKGLVEKRKRGMANLVVLK
ncbi:MAG: MarR family transcriptional regulator [Candidatus Anstonellaceae archaeon]